MEFLRQLWMGLVEAWSKLSLSARVNIAIAGLGVVLAVALAAYFGAQPSYVTLASDLSPDQANKIIQVLEQQNTPYRVEDANKVIRVPAAQRSPMLLALAENDVPLGRTETPGLELFKDTDIMTNKWLRDVNYMRAIQGEIEKQLNALDFVEYSMVLIREAREELFVSEQKPSEASVTLKVSRPPTKKNIKGLVNMVAAAGGPNLNAGNITITTTDGEVLYMPPSSEYAALANSKLEHVAELEKRAEQRIMDSLDQLGVQGTVRVSAKVNFDEKEMTEEKYTEGTALSEMENTSTLTSTEKLPEGAPGVLANVAEGTTTPGGIETQEETSETISNYEPSRLTTNTKVSPGEVQKFTVALVVEGDRETSTDADGNETETYIGLTEARSQFYRDLVAGAVGEGAESTEITVNDFPFEVSRMAQQSADQAYQAAQLWSMVSGWSTAAVQLLLILVGFFLVRMFIMRAIEAPPAEPVVEEVEEIPKMSSEDMRRNEVAQSIAELASDSPDVVATLLRSWLNEEES
ncbi:MAG: flagellar M-ring protein FliF [Candidatus Hydrogenedens sp.]|nr:flagellar M-ring protein FliF [Candidatus Hydrogenedens sp.]